VKLRPRLTIATGLAAVVIAAAVVGFDRWVARTVIPDLDVEVSTIVLDRNEKLLRAYTVADGRWRLDVGVDFVDPAYLTFLIAYEDRRFYRHSGVDVLALLRAVAQAAWNGRIVSGGSTLTMQVARLLEESGTGRWHSKIRQARLALALERRLTKREILDLYLLLAPFGGNLEGVRAASLAYFGKEPARLTAAQIALLVALPQSPEKRRPDRATAAAKDGRDRILNRLVGAGVLAPEEAQAAKSEQVPGARRDFPAIAAHVADRAVTENPLNARHRLTIDRPLQQKLEALAKSVLVDQISTMSAAILVMDHQTGEVLASVGSAGYLDQGRAGFIDMTRAIRSPGSTLKPLIYGLAFDQGLAHPETLIRDQPTAFGSYAPQNFDKQFYGTLPVRQALQLSLNIPAVALLEAVGPSVLMSRMRRAGVDARLPGAGAPGLAVALGGVGVNLQDMVKLYAAIARGGRPVSLRRDFTPDLRVAPLEPLMSPTAAWQVADILTGVRGPLTAPRNHLAYKTGTSYGYRDAWAIGFDGRHVIGVWMGRADGASIPGILGADLAAPVLFAAFERLKAELTPLSAPPPATLLVLNADLPQPLKRFRGVNAVFEIDSNPPEIAFPPDGARIDLGLASNRHATLVLKVRSGTPPFTWIADGKPFLVADHDRQAELAPAGPGFVEISVIDANGQSQRTRVELR